jgi:hypothetical protein
MLNKFTFTSEEGDGYAIQSDGGPWRIYAPWGHFKFIGTKAEAVRKVKQVGEWAGHVRVVRKPR